MAESSENKLQIRAKILSAIVNLQNNHTDMSFVGNTLDDLNTINDKTAVLDILHKELLKDNSEIRDYTITFLIGELIDKEQSEKLMFETLANPKINDKIKSKIVNFLRECGKHVNYDQYMTYFENPDEIIDADTVKLLENAKINPEAQIDFMDFIHALPEAEKNVLVESMNEDFDGDNLANILIPLIVSSPYSDLAQIAIKALGESRSLLAFPVLQNLLDTTDDLAVKANVQKSMSMLKLSGVKEDITGDYYKKLLAVSPVYQCFASFPDGHGNVGLIFSRKNEFDFIQMFATVVNDIDGIIDCFGFNEISESEFERIVSKFYQNGKVVQIDEHLCKLLLLDAEKISRLKYKEFSYEYAAWSMITKDVEPATEINSAVFSKIAMNEFLLQQLYEKDYFAKWFFDVAHNDAFAALIDKIADNKIFDINEINRIVEENKTNVFDSAFLRIFNNRLLLGAYLIKNDNEDAFADMIYSLREDSSIKDKFMTDILKKSIYEYFLSQKDRYDNLKSATSIFTRKSNKDLNEIDINYIKNCITEIEKHWV